MAKAKPAPKPQKKKTELQLIADEIAGCRDASGRVVPRKVVEMARNPNTVCHRRFEWDVSRAAEREWLRTAAELIRSVRFIVEHEDRQIAVPFYLSDPSREDSGYIATSRVARNAAMSERVLRDEVDRIIGAIHRATKIATVFGLSSSFERMLQQAIEIETRIDELGGAELRT